MENCVVIRFATLKDMLDVNCLCKDFIIYLGQYNPRLLNWYKKDQSYVRNHIKERIEHNGLLVAEINQQIVGFLIFKESFYPGQEEWKVVTITDIYVKDEFRHRLIGRSLIEECFKILRANNFSEVNLTVQSKDEKAKRFYFDLGFEADEITMKKNLLEHDFRNSFFQLTLL